MDGEPASERPSRQSLVVERRPSSLPLAFGATVCAVLGFGLVFCLGIGRSAGPRTDADQAAATPPAALAPADDAGPVGSPQDGPRRFSNVPHGDSEPAGDRWRPRVSDARPIAEPDPPPDRYAARMTSLEAPPELLRPAADTRALSRHEGLPAPRDAGTELVALQPVDEPPVGAESSTPAADSLPAATPEPLAPASPEGPAARQPAADDLQPAPAAGWDPAVAPAEPPAARQPPAAARSWPPQAPREDAGDLASPPLPFAAAPPTNAGATPPAVQPQRFPSRPPRDEVATPQPRPAAVSQPDWSAPPSRPPSDPAPRTAPAIPAFASAPPIPAAPAAAALPFASAPPLAGPGPSEPAGSDDSRATAAASGQGRPGPMQLEGLQSPQLAIEKRGPREVQVGKAVRYEILVRNSGGATAHDVMLRDAVPQGAALVTTTPPASPTGTVGELLWPLGSLPPGGQARVVMEVMPQVEGEIGSVASVSFRTDASIRSRATKPDLRLEASAPAPALIGRDIQFTIKVTNPGTGVATGVVLEGFLPENVSHRSGRELEFDVGQLRPGESRTIDLVLGTRSPGVHAARFAARADGGLAVDQQVRLEVTAPTIELAIDMPLRRFLQRPATATIAIVNAGTAEAKGIELAAQLPPGMKFLRANNAGWHDDRTHRVLWSLEELPAGETGTVELVVMPVEFGPQKIAAAARTADGLSHQAAHVCEVEGLAAVTFEVLDSEDPIEVGGLTEYVVRVTNQGTKPATGVRLSTALLGDLEPVAAEGPVGHRIENLTVMFEPLAKLAPAEEAVFRVRVRGRRAGDQRVQVQLVSADHPAAITKEEVTRVYDDR